MEKQILYIKLNQNVLVEKEDVFLNDVASVFCQEQTIQSKARSLKLFHFHDTKKQRKIVSIVKVVEELTKQLPNIDITNLGETDVILEYLPHKPRSQVFLWIKIIFVAAICFIGTAFTIMAFHNDIGIQHVFQRIYQIVTGEISDGCTCLEISYSIGLGLGIIVFYNHIGGRRLSKDPTPIEVEMRNYERDVNLALVETAEREGKEQDV